MECDQKIADLSVEKVNWGTQEFASADIGDARLNERLIKMAEAFLEYPGASVPEASSNWAGAKGIYRFLNNKKVTLQKILSPHMDSTKKRMKDKKKFLPAFNSELQKYIIAMPYLKPLLFLLLILAHTSQLFAYQNAGVRDRAAEGGTRS